MPYSGVVATKYVAPVVAVMRVGFEPVGPGKKSTTSLVPGPVKSVVQSSVPLRGSVAAKKTGGAPMSVPLLGPSPIACGDEPGFVPGAWSMSATSLLGQCVVSWGLVSSQSQPLVVVVWPGGTGPLRQVGTGLPGCSSE